jgi:hypothetical protein
MFLSCRQIYEEASSIFYKYNTFLFVRLYASTPTECDMSSCWLTRVAVSWMQMLGTLLDIPKTDQRLPDWLGISSKAALVSGNTGAR